MGRLEVGTGDRVEAASAARSTQRDTLFAKQRTGARTPRLGS